jgi:hypothetical protein
MSVGSFSRTFSGDDDILQPVEWVRIEVAGHTFSVHGLVLGFAADGSGDYICQVHGVKRRVKSVRIES